MSEADTLPSVRTHDNRQAAGILKDGTLVLKLRAGRGLWRPERETGPALDIEAFGEFDGPLTAPSPLIRVPEGTIVLASIQNNLDTALRVHGLCEHSGSPAPASAAATASASASAAACPTIEVPAGVAREIKFPAGRAGTYAWWAETTGVPPGLRFGPDSQLSGAFIVDPSRAGAPEADRVFVITEWTDLQREQLRKIIAADDPFMAALMMMKKGTTLINGLSWPDTERLTYRVGEPVRWRIINASGEPHPLHLHGFYFDVDSVGDGLRDTQYADGQKKHVVTQLVPVGHTVALTWTPERIGNWLFHCHIMEHVEAARRLGSPSPPSSDAHQGHGGHGGGHDTLAGMAGMVLGITVLGATGTAVDAIERAPAPPRRLTLAMRSAPNRFGSEPAYGFILTEPSQSSPAASSATSSGASSSAATDDQVRAPGPTIVLRRDEPVEITLVNQLPEATAVHWHGMELDSFYDGVHGFGGIGDQRTPLIDPGGSFIVRFTPPRTGTFMYHTHMHDKRQLSTGLYGPMLVIDPAETHDPDTDHALVVGVNGIGSGAAVVLNGSAKPRFSWRAGTRHRLRLMNITRHDIVRLSLTTADGPVMWRPLTKDGAPVPSGDAAPRRAEQTIAVGETYDFEYEAPASRKDLWIEVRGMDGRWHLQTVAVVKD